MADASNPNNHNPAGVNQHKDCPPRNDERTNQALIDYQHRGITNHKIISALLKAEHGIRMSESTVAKRRKDLGLTGSHVTVRDVPASERRQLVLDQLDRDPAGMQGPRTIRENIVYTTGILLTRDYVTAEMRLHAPEGFTLREPSSRKIKRGQLVALGPHHQWSADGHDKLSAIGFPAWAIRDVWSGLWLGIWTIPNNRYKNATAYLYLRQVEELGGMSITMTTDCGSETGRIFGLANALREVFSPDLPADEIVAHQFVRSVRNITIERGWLQFRLRWGENVKIFWDAGAGIYNPNDPKQYDLVQFLWPRLIQQELDELKERFNNHVVRYDRNKLLPSGVAPNVAYALCEQYGGQNCLQPVDRAVIRRLMDELGGEDLIRFVSVEYEAKAERVYRSLGIAKLAFDNIWAIFRAMLPLM